MITPSELKKMGEDISSEFMERGTPLTENLQKLAEDKGLNNEQVNRVAESANIETYLALMKTSEDKYLSFDVADATAVHGVLKEGGTTPIYDNSDYEVGPEKEASVKDIFAMYAANDTLAEEDPADKEYTNTRLIKEANHVKGQIDFVMNKEAEYATDLESVISHLYNDVKQRVLGDYPFNKIAAVIKSACPIVGPPIIGMFIEKLASEAPHKDLSGEFDGVVNKYAEFFKDFRNFEEGIIDIIKLGKLKEALCEKYAGYEEKGIADIEKYAKSTTIGLIRGLVDFGKKHKGLVGLAVGAPLVYQMGRAKERRKQLLDIQRAALGRRKVIQTNY